MSQAQTRLTVMDVIPLTAHLLKWIIRGRKCPEDDADGVRCESLEYVEVSRFLRKNFHWRVADMNGVPIENVSCVTVSAVDRVVSLPQRHDDYRV